MAFTHGSKAAFTLDGTDLSAWFNNTGLNRSRDTHDVTTFGNDDHRFISGLKGGTVPLSGPYDPAADALLFAAAENAAALAFEFWPNGDTGGAPTATQPSYTGNLLITNHTITTSATAEAQLSADFTLDGAVTRNVA